MISDILRKAPFCNLCRLISQLIFIDLIRKHSDQDEGQDFQAIIIKCVPFTLCDTLSLYPMPVRTHYHNPGFALVRNMEEDLDPTLAQQRTPLPPDENLMLRPFAPNFCQWGRVTKSDRIDFNWIRERLSLCDARSVRPTFHHTVSIKVIDVTEMCITELEPEGRYVVLSYTWGSVQQFMLTKDVRARLYRAHGLTEFMHLILKTIRDAIELTRMIGEQYLWVDALCIVQDDHESKMEHIQYMGVIYYEAILMTQACCGKDASYGLPGVQKNSRRVYQVYEQVGDIVLGNKMPESKSDDYDSVWGTRAWTLQEKVLSRRMIRISDEAVSWWCWHAGCSEDENCRHENYPVGEPDRNWIFFSVPDTRGEIGIKEYSAFDTYNSSVSDYTRRNLSYQSDALNAVSGILHHLRSHFLGEFVHGLPDVEFERALMWYPVGICSRRLDQHTGKPIFSSWSWLGWVGHAAYPWILERTFPVSTVGLPLRWEGSSADENEVWFTTEQYRMANQAPAKERHRSSVDPWCVKEQGTDTVLLESTVRAPRAFSYLRPHAIDLRLRTLCAKMILGNHIRARKTNFNYSYKLFQQDVLSKDGKLAGCIYTPDPQTMEDDYRANFQGQKEFIIISRASIQSDPRFDVPIHTTHDEWLPQSWVDQIESDSPLFSSSKELGIFDMEEYFDGNPWCLFNVIMIEWVGKIANRISVGRIHVKAFLDAGPIEMKVYLE
jgi:hypothetical protein